MKKIAILGSTGSIGTQALDVIARNRNRFSVSVLSCSRRIEQLCSQIEEFNPELVVVEKEKDAIILSEKYPGTQVDFGEKGLIRAAASKCDMVLNSLMGIRGLIPTYYGLKAGNDIAFANKETLVAGGELITQMAEETGARLLPVDSEHSAIFQCLQGNPEKALRRILLTASGGPFRGYSLEQLEQVTLEQALRHPKWNMGSKITIDSATLMNKGLEVIEAKWLFGVHLDQIEVIVHPQSIVHSAVEYHDGAVIAQMGKPDMRIPISYAFSYPDRLANDFDSLDLFTEGANLTFEKPDPKVFKNIQLAYDASLMGGSYPVVLNGANEVLVQLFLEGKIRFIDIQNTIEKVLNAHKPKYNLELEGILEMDRQAREAALSFL
ncbi:1-deoxy-D-xylulose-5-phosphate reductoisomerase [Anaerovorax odorimutans]|uniref:1-deoxy-D-xylulose 5-phosphate reductoisomerase n=1 Tax=Anaerovorax odorimutans TaxID=109327 RepID=A0ABT1RMX6_9FIRM|nr:1-deoxy-D-xylulose-5-phosphate reductoisomerase [Anaerovorax odorimutans]MCQ4636533.1 1-deoxy-D-xylulose-5-phosphate reductoisomerase [Anaerovorax odorimutans]